MIKTACSLLLTLLIISGSSAQSLQVKGGLNYTTVTGQSGNSFKPGYYVGLAKEIRLSKQVSFQPEILYSLQGSHRKFFNYPQAVTYHYHYIQVPLYFNFLIVDKVGILWGPQIGILTRANIKIPDRDDQRLSLIPMMNAFDVSIGGGPYFKITDQLKAEVRVSVGMSEISREDERLRNLVIQAGVSWLLTKPGNE